MYCFKPIINLQTICRETSVDKLAEDNWTISYCLKHKKDLPCTVLRNGKQDLATFKNTQPPPFSAHLAPLELNQKKLWMLRKLCLKCPSLNLQ